MKFFNLKFEKNSSPILSSLRPPIFDVDSHWFLALGVFFSIFIITLIIGSKLFYSVYFESYKKEVPKEDPEALVNTKKLKTLIQKRGEFINQEISLPQDPSL